MKILLITDKEAFAKNSPLSLVKINEFLDKELEVVEVNGENIFPCIGCYQCWIKTPGICFQNDEINTLLAKVINCDLLIIVSKITYGGYSYDIKSFFDRTIPLISPSFKKINKEMHHDKRYKNFPNLINLAYGECSDEEKETFTTLIKRNVINYHIKKFLTLFTYNKLEFKEALNKITTFISEEL